jgi:hypothetical protein
VLRPAQDQACPAVALASVAQLDEIEQKRANAVCKYLGLDHAVAKGWNTKDEAEVKKKVTMIFFLFFFENEKN